MRSIAQHDLARVEERAVDVLGDREIEVAVGSHVRRVLAAELEPCADEALPRPTLDHVPTLDRSGEDDEIDPRVGDHRGHVVVGGDDVLEHTVRNTRGREGGTHALGAQQRLGGVLEHHRVARQQGRYQRVHGAQVGVVPRGDDQHRAQRVAADELLESLRRIDWNVGEPLAGDRDHVPRPLLEAAPDLVAAVPHRAAHLVCQLDRDLVGDGLHVDDHPLAQSLPLAERHRPPLVTRDRWHVPGTPSSSSGEAVVRSAYTEPSIGDTICCTGMACRLRSRAFGRLRRGVRVRPPNPTIHRSENDERCRRSPTTPPAWTAGRQGRADHGCRQRARTGGGRAVRGGGCEGRDRRRRRRHRSCRSDPESGRRGVVRGARCRRRCQRPPRGGAHDGDVRRA